MNSVVYIYSKSEGEEISGHIDLSARSVTIYNIDITHLG